MARTPPFQGENEGSIPSKATKFASGVWQRLLHWFDSNILLHVGDMPLRAASPFRLFPCNCALRLVAKSSLSHGEDRWFESSRAHQVYGVSGYRFGPLTFNQVMVGSTPTYATNFEASGSRPVM